MSDVTEDKNIIQRFRDRALEFNRLYESLRAKRVDVSQYPALAVEYNKLVTTGDSIRNSIRTVTGGIDSVVGWYNSVFGDDKEGLKGLGVLPLVPVAVAVTAIAAMGKWGRDVYLFDRRLTEVKRLEDTGISPGRAADIVGGKAPGIFAGVTREVMIPVTVGGVSLIALWMWFKYGKK